MSLARLFCSAIYYWFKQLLSAIFKQPYSEEQRRALLAHRTQILPESFFVSLPAELRRLAFATAYFVRLSPSCASGEHEPDLLYDLD